MTNDPTHLVRSCAICRKRTKKSELLRLVLAEREVRLDPVGNAPGRGAYVHPRAECVTRMNDAERWAHHFRVGRGEVDRESLRRVYEECMRRIGAVAGSPARDPKGSRLRL